MNNPIRLIDPNGMWVENADSYTTDDPNEIMDALRMAGGSEGDGSNSKTNEDEDKKNDDAKGGIPNDTESTVSDALRWIEDHYYYGVEGDVTYGLQAGAICKNLIGFELVLFNQKVWEGEFSNKKRQSKSYDLKPVLFADKVEIFKIAGAYAGLGAGYKWNRDSGKNVHTVNLGWNLIQGSLSFNGSGITGGFFGLDFNVGASLGFWIFSFY